MATLRNKWKLAAVTRETQEEHPRQMLTHSGIVPGTSRNTNLEKPGNEWGRLPEWSSSWSRPLPQPDYTKLWPRSWSWHGDRSYRMPWHGDRSYRTPRHGDKSYRRISQSSRYGDRRFRRDSQWPWHGDRSSRRDSQWPWHGDRRGKRDSKWRWHGDRTSERESMWPWHGDRNSRRDSFLLPCNFFRKTKESALHKSATIRSEKTPATIEADQICWPFNNWRLTAILPMSITTTTESQNCLIPSRQQCPPSTGNQRNLNYLKICSKRV